MEKIFQVLFVFILLMLVIRAFAHSQDKKFRDYKFSGRIRLAEIFLDAGIIGAIDKKTVFVSGNEMFWAIDTDTYMITHIIQYPATLRGMTIAANIYKGFFLQGGSITITDLSTLHIERSISLNDISDHDLILYDSFHGYLFLFHKEINTVTVLNAGTLSVIENIVLPGTPGFVVSDDNGKLYLTIDSGIGIVEIDSLQLAITQQWFFERALMDKGLTIDVANHLLFSSAGKKTLLVWDYQEGRIVNTLNIPVTAEIISFDRDAKLIAVSDKQGALILLKQINREEYKIVQELTTQKDCQAIVMDPLTKKIFLIYSNSEISILTT